MEIVYVVIGLASFVVTILVIVKIFQIANNTNEIKELLIQIKKSQGNKPSTKISAAPPIDEKKAEQELNELINRLEQNNS